jgi:hypothetical protein
MWRVADWLTLRAAGFRVLKRRISSDQGLEPTQLAGFNQFFDDANGTVAEAGGVAADILASRTLAAGLQLTRRSLKVPYDLGGVVFFQRQTEETAGAYLYWQTTQRVSLALQPQYQHFMDGALFDQMDLLEVPLGVRVFLPSGVWMGASINSVIQSGEFSGVEDSDSFVLVDAIVAYRLPRRMGTISIQGTNLFNEKFKFQEIDAAVTPRYVPERRVLLRVSLNF